MLASLALVGLVLAGHHQPDKAVLLQYRPPLNKAFRYAITIDGQGAFPVHISLVKTMKATGQEKGVVEVLTTFSDVDLGPDSSGQSALAARMVATAQVHQHIDATGRILDSDADRSIAQLMAGGVDAYDALVFGPNPVKAGDTWTVPFDNGGKHQDATLQLVRFHDLHGRNLASISLKIADVQSTDPPIQAEVDASTGVLERFELKGSAAAPKGGESSLHVLIERK